MRLKRREALRNVVANAKANANANVDDMRKAPLEREAQFEIATDVSSARSMCRNSERKRNEKKRRAETRKVNSAQRLNTLR